MKHSRLGYLKEIWQSSALTMLFLSRQTQINTSDSSHLQELIEYKTLTRSSKRIIWTKWRVSDLKGKWKEVLDSSQTVGLSASVIRLPIASRQTWDEAVKITERNI
jgi:hypothetical protein